MRKCLTLTSLLVALAVARTARAEEKEGLQKLLPQWKEAWNSGDLPSLVKLMDPAGKLRNKYERDEKSKDAIAKEFAGMVEEFGKIESYELRKYIERKQRFVVRITYSKKGMVAGTFKAVKVPDAKWYLDANIDGQGEPELKQ